MTSHHSLIVRSILHYYNVQYIHPRSQTQDKGQKGSKISFLDIWVSQKGIFMDIEWFIMSNTMTKSYNPFISIKICNIKSFWRPKLEKMTENQMDHSKRPKRVYASHGKNFILFLKSFRCDASTRFGPFEWSISQKPGFWPFTWVWCIGLTWYCIFW